MFTYITLKFLEVYSEESLIFTFYLINKHTFSFLYTFIGASLRAQLVKNLPAMWETWVWSLGWEDSLEKGTATHSSILAWRIPWPVYSPWSRKELDITERLSLKAKCLSLQGKTIEIMIFYIFLTLFQRKLYANSRVQNAHIHLRILIVRDSRHSAYL